MRQVRRTETGSSLIEFTWLAVLLLVPLLYIVLAVFDVQRSAFAVSAAASAAGRTYSLSATEAVAADRARAAASVALKDQGVDPGRTEVVVTCVPDPLNCLSPGSVIEVDVSTAVALPLVPSALGANTPSIRVEGRHRVPYGTFREARP